MGSGAWYGVPDYAEYTMVYYNKDLFAKYGIAEPTSFEEFTAALAAFAAKGVTPLANGGSEYIAQQYVYQLALSKADRAWVDAFERYRGKVDFHDPAWTYAAETFADWVKKGYIGEKSTGANAEQAIVSFLQGKSPMLFSGSWLYGRFQDEAKFDWTTTLWPGSDLTLGSGGNLWVVPKNAANKELAYDFIDITLSKKIQDLLGNKGGVPVAADPGSLTDAKSRILNDQFAGLTERDGLAFYPDWPATGFYDVLVSETQKLITGSTGPDAYLDALQQGYDKGAPKR
jgi:raffinose/stachyose/melibiose transport system substrate-binding protein